MTKHQKVIVCELGAAKSSNTFTIAAHEQLYIVLIATTVVEYRVALNLVGQKGEVIIIGLIIGQDNHTLTIHTLQNHLAPDTKSDLHIKSVLFGRSTFNYEGIIQIAPEAQRSNAYQRNDNLLLSEEAKAESKPALEILANDVRCTHGATLGKIDEEQLFYLQSRGINQHMAEQLITHGFLEAVIAKIPDKRIQAQLRIKISAVIERNTKYVAQSS